MPWIPGALATQRSCCVHGVALDTPCLVVVLRGMKRLHARQLVWTVHAGDFAMLHRPEPLDMEAVTPCAGSCYRSWVLPFPWRVIELARSLFAAHGVVPGPRGPAITTGRAAVLLPALGTILDGAGPRGMSPAALDHGLLGVLIALVRRRHGQFLHAEDVSLSGRIRLLVGTDPARPWSSPLIEREVHASGATVRRRLAEEGTSLREIVRDVRLHRALLLLETTDRPVKAVARDCGYRSQASFRRSFATRFGVEPSAVGA